MPAQLGDHKGTPLHFEKILHFLKKEVQLEKNGSGYILTDFCFYSYALAAVPGGGLREILRRGRRSEQEIRTSYQLTYNRYQKNN